MTRQRFRFSFARTHGLLFPAKRKAPQIIRHDKQLRSLCFIARILGEREALDGTPAIALIRLMHKSSDAARITLRSNFCLTHGTYGKKTRTEGAVRV
ncbi:MAG TPA: hypothetical protein VNH44_05210 [Micropepsaceae bacterium]|nr:hypothetical protein [Micropepsaceae bacterium]